MADSFTIHHLPGRTISHDGRDYLFFSGTAYLGLPQHPVFQQLTAEAIAQYGTVFGSSRNGNLRLGIYDEAEARLAAVVGAPAALTVSSGMMAGQVVVSWLHRQRFTLCYGPHTHPALWNGPVVDLPTRSFADWVRQLPDQLRALPPLPTAILVNSLDAVRSAYYSFEWVNDLPDDRPVLLVVDDSHGLGVLNHGRGIWPQIPRRSSVNLLVTGSLAKAMGLPGGVILGDSKTISAVQQTAFFGACSPMAPALLAAYLRAEDLYREGLIRLGENVKLAEKLLLPTGLFSHAPGYPVFYTEQDDLYAHLLKANIVIYSFAYPTATDRANTRIVISAFHDLADIQALASAVYSFIF